MAADVEVICPPVEILTTTEREVPCTVQGCSRIFPSKATLRMHVVKTHNVVESEEEKRLFTRSSQNKTKAIVKHFYCPVVGCSRSQSCKKPFPRLGQLKQHYMTVHGEKKHICSKCKLRFGMEDACRRHEEKCGQMFPCSCGCPFTTREAMLMHARIKQHPLAADDPLRLRNEKARQAAVAALAANIVYLPKVKKRKKKPKDSGSGRYCMILPKPLVPSSTHSNMVMPFQNLRHFTSFGLPCVIKKDSQTQTDDVSRNTSTSHRGKINKPLIKSSSTQTSLSPLPHMDQFDINHQGISDFADLSQSSIGIQVNELVATSQNVSTMLDFATGTESQYFDFCTNTVQASIGTQLDGDTFMERTNFAVIDDSLCLNSQTQTLLTSADLQYTDSRFLSSSQTQTQDFEQVSLEDNAAQTLISVLDFDPNCSADCGTQTQRMFEELFDQTADVELTESQTQTWFHGLVTSETDTGIVNQNFHDRTTIDDFVDIHAQTRMMMPELVDASFDVGLTHSETQTIPESFSNHGWVPGAMNTQTQMTQTAAEICSQFGDNISLMDTYTQTLLDDNGDMSSLSSVKTQT